MIDAKTLELCEKIAKSFNEYYLGIAQCLNVKTSIVFVEDIGLFSVVWESRDDLEELGIQELFNDEFDPSMDGCVQKISNVDESSLGDTITPYADVVSLFGQVFADFYDMHAVYILLRHENLLEDVKEKLEMARQNIFHQVFGDAMDLPDDLGYTENLIELNFEKKSKNN